MHRQTCRHAQPTPTAPALFECGDGRYVYFVLFVADDKPFRTLVEWMETLGVEADLNEPKFADAAYRQANFGHVQDLVEVFFLLQTAEPTPTTPARPGGCRSGSPTPPTTCSATSTCAGGTSS